MSNYGVIHIRIAYRLPFAMFDGNERKYILTNVHDMNIFKFRDFIAS